MRSRTALPPDILDHLVAVGEQCRLTVFAGAGISAAPPASLPLARTMTRTIVGSLCGGEKDKAFWMAVDRLRPERLLSVVHEVMGDAGFTPLQLLANATPNRNHRAIAALADAGRLAAVITTNFDTAIEQALTDLDVPFTPMVLESDFAGWDGESFPLPLLKLHGSLPFGKHAGGALDAMMEQVGRPLARPRTQLLVHFLETTTMLVVGYSGRDDFDIYPVLYNSKGQMVCIWVAHPVAPPPSRRRYRSRDEDAGLGGDDFLTLWAEPVVTDPVERLEAAPHLRVSLVQMDAGVALDELCGHLASSETFAPPDEETAPTKWQRDVAVWAKQYERSGASRRLEERIRSEGAVRATKRIDEKSGIDRLQETLRQQIERGDVVSQPLTLLALGIACDEVGRIEDAIHHLVACLSILSKTDDFAVVRTGTVFNTPQELQPQTAREAMGRLIALIISRKGWPLAEKALIELDRHIRASDTRRYLRAALLDALQRLDVKTLDVEWLRWAIETLSVSEEELAIPSHIDPTNPENRVRIADLMAEHIRKEGMPLWKQMIEPLAVVDAARPRLVFDCAARWGKETRLDRPLLPWFTALWLGRGEEEFDERLEFLEELLGHPNNPAAQEAAAYSLRVLARHHCREVIGMLTRLAMFHPDALARGNLVRVVESESYCRKQAIALLKQLRKDRSEHVRAMASEKLREVRGPLWRGLFGLLGE